ncbi:MAG: hypothetical protein CMP09_20925 [Yangia sp.]|nr:hypothetical protein [Salipiger sp.]
MNVELGFISLAVLMGLLAMRVPIGLALIGVAVGGLYLLRGVNPAFSAAKVTPLEFVAHWTLSAIPMFILMGAIASNAGMIASIYAAARIWLRRLPGGLAIATSFAGAGFAAMSGSTRTRPRLPSSPATRQVSSRRTRRCRCSAGSGSRSRARRSIASGAPAGG